jgi:drug/metabolite transporter (DMT)-like permease
VQQTWVARCFTTTGRPRRFRHTHSFVTGYFAVHATPIPLLLGILLFTDSIPTLGPQYLPALLLGGTLNVLALFQFMRALQVSDISLAIPFVSFTPFFLLLTSPLLVGDRPDTQDVAGILCIVAGAYLLQIQSTPTCFRFNRPLKGGLHLSKLSSSNPDQDACYPLP